MKAYCCKKAGGIGLIAFEKNADFAFNLCRYHLCMQVCLRIFIKFRKTLNNKNQREIKFPYFCTHPVYNAYLNIIQ